VQPRGKTRGEEDALSSSNREYSSRGKSLAFQRSRGKKEGVALLWSAKERGLCSQDLRSL